MKVSSASSTSTAVGAGAAKPAADGFRLLLSEGGLAARAPVSGVAGAWRATSARP